jgi:hypothetical protein
MTAWFQSHKQGSTLGSLSGSVQGMYFSVWSAIILVPSLASQKTFGIENDGPNEGVWFNVPPAANCQRKCRLHPAFEIVHGGFTRVEKKNCDSVRTIFRAVRLW